MRESYHMKITTDSDMFCGKVQYTRTRFRRVIGLPVYYMAGAIVFDLVSYRFCP